MTDKRIMSALRIDLGDSKKAPKDIRILPAGKFKAIDGRPDLDESTDGHWHLDAHLAAIIIASVNEQKNDVLIDYEHQSRYSMWNGQPVPAAGWIKRLEWREGSGLWALDVEWTEKARTAIEAGEYRYLSPVFYSLVPSGKVVELISVALTNSPALDGLFDLTTHETLLRRQSAHHLGAGADAPGAPHFLSTGDLPMTMTPAQIEALKAEHAANGVALSVLTTQCNALRAENSALKQAQVQAAAAADAAKRETLVAQALTDGRLLPAQKGWALAQELPVLEGFLQSAVGVQALTGKQSGPAHGAAGANGLTDVELQMCTKTGITPEDFLKAKTQRDAQAAAHA